MTSRIRGLRGTSEELELGSGGSKIKSTDDGTVTIYENDGSTKGTIDVKDLAVSGTATGISKAMVGLGNVSNTAPADLPVSTAQQSALDLKQDLSAKGANDGYCPLDSTGKIASQYLNIEAMEYKGSYDAANNSPALANGTGNKGDFYIVSAAGTQLGIDWIVGDTAVYSGSVWERVGREDKVVSVAGKIGAVTLVKGDVGLGNVDNTSDANKPVSTATQTALDLKAPLDDAALTGATTAVGLTVTNAVSAGSGSITGDLTVDTSTLKVDSTNNNVGVGTASPASKLEVYSGNADINGGNLSIRSGAGLSPKVTISHDGNDDKLSIDAAIKSTAVAQSKFSGSVDIAGAISCSSGVTLSGDLAVDTDSLKVDSTNNRVGVGISSPSERLEVYNGNLDVNGGEISLRTGAGGAQKVTLSHDNSDNKLSVDKALKVTSTDASSVAGDLSVSGDLTAANIITAGNVDGVDIAALKSLIDNSKVRYVAITHNNAGSATNFGDALASGAFCARTVVKITEAFGSGIGSLSIGDGSDADGFGVVSSEDLQSVGTIMIYHAAFLNSPLSEAKQLAYTLGGSSATGACTISVQQELI